MRPKDTSRTARSPLLPGKVLCALGYGVLLLACGSYGVAPPTDLAEGVQPRGPAPPMPPHDWQPGPSSSFASADPLDEAWLTEDVLALLSECARQRGEVDPCTELPPEFDFAWVGSNEPIAVATAARSD